MGYLILLFFLWLVESLQLLLTNLNGYHTQFHVSRIKEHLKYEVQYSKGIGGKNKCGSSIPISYILMLCK